MFNAWSIRELCPVKEFENTFISSYHDLIIEKGPISDFGKYEISQLVCPSDCEAKFDNTLELQNHLKFNCSRIDHGTVTSEQVNELMTTAGNIQAQQSFVRKATETRSFLLKCPLSSPLAAYLKSEELKIYDSQPPPNRNAVPYVYKVNMKNANCYLFFDLTLLKSKFERPATTGRRALVINPQCTHLPIPGLTHVVNENIYHVNGEELKTDREEGNPYSSETFNGVLSYELRWDRNLTLQDIEDILKSSPVAIIVKGSRNLFGKQRLTILDEFTSPFPVNCQEALKASKLGRSELIPYEVPGIPRKKFADVDVDQYEQYTNEDGSVKQWPAQSFFEIEGRNKQCVVLFEGWTVTEVHDIQDLKEKTDDETIAAVFKRSRIRASFLAGIENCGSAEMKKAAKKQRFMDYENPSQSDLFWVLEDMSFFHSKIQEEYRQAPIIYISLDGESQPPIFSFTPINVISNSTYRKWSQSGVNETGPDGNDGAFEKDSQERLCEMPNQCHCYTTFLNLVNRCEKDEDAQYLRLTPDGLLDLSNYNETASRIIVECSDRCGCSYKCPRRAVQKGQQKPLIVFYENQEEGYSLRSGGSFKKGEFVGEVTGWIKEKTAEVQQFMFTFLSSDLVLDTEEVGNALRFLSHSKSPNATLIETYSKYFESDPVVPRMAVYATKDIHFGDKITIA
ncbi:hypothetical protein CAEBREN_07978 [Caenorhabditis brenneri]|uniref:SET domain-containing protein n=1 Tax=Caenorhabditis brenneri TaxID=135651 RepID=G0M8B7_CAEBE|nr:hypothetical protein CAEBREN_07978 [Caenorhabditis brenneri]